MPWSRTQVSQSAVAEMAEEATGMSFGGGASGLSAALVTSPQEGKLLTKAPILRWDLFIYLNLKSETKPFYTIGTDCVLSITQLLPDPLHQPSHPSSCSLSQTNKQTNP